MEQPEETLELLKEIRKKYRKINIWLYTGYTFEECLKDERKKKILPYLDVMVDGRYEEGRKAARWCGSDNQRVIDVMMSLWENKAVLWKPNTTYQKYRKK